MPQKLLTVYCYSGCGTCRKALAWLKEKNIAIDLRAIRETPPSLSDLHKALSQYGSLRKLFNTSGGEYKQMGLSTKLSELSDQQALALLHANGNLVKRPFVVLPNAKVLVGFDPANWSQELGI